MARQPAPHRDPVKQGVEPEGTLRVRMIDLAITGKQRFSAAGIFVGATEQRLREIEQGVAGPRIAKIDQTGEFWAAAAVTLGQHVSLLKIVVTENRPRARLQKGKARLRLAFQPARQGLVRALIAKLPERLVERGAHVVVIARKRP